MAIKAAKCPSCGANLNIDEGRKKAFCEYCGSPFIVEDAIQNFVVHNTVNVASVGTLNVNSDQTADARIEAGEAFLKLKKYQDAYDAFNEAIKIKPYDYRAYWGKIRVLTHDFTVRDYNRVLSDSERIRKIFTEMCVFLPADQQATYLDTLIKYYESLFNAVKDTLLKNKQSIGKRKNEIQERLIDLQSKEKELEKMINKNSALLFGSIIFALAALAAFIWNCSNEMHLIPIAIFILFIVIVALLIWLWQDNSKIISERTENIIQQRKNKSLLDNFEDDEMNDLNSQLHELENIRNQYI